MIEILRVTFNGKEFIGYRTIIGKRKLSQSVTFNGKTDVDSAQYKAKEKDGPMQTVAEQMLAHLASGRTLVNSK